MTSLFRAGALLAGLLALLHAGVASAATITVSLNDMGGGMTLRDALSSANDGDELVIPSGTLTLSQGELVVTKHVTIRGAGARQTVIDGANLSRILHVQAGAALTLTGVRLTHGSANGNGGAVLVDAGSAQLTEDAFDANSATVSGGDALGGAIAVVGGATLGVTRSLVSGNTVTSTDSNASGGGIGVGGVDTKFTLRDSTVFNNLAKDLGTGIARGGGVALVGSNASAANTNITLSGSTLAANRVARTTGSALGGNIAHEALDSGTTATVHTRNTIITDGSGGFAGGAAQPLFDDCGGSADIEGGTQRSATLDGHNYVKHPDGSSTCRDNNATDVHGTVTFDPAEPSDNGGATNTLRPADASATLAHGDADANPDQRGVARPATPDIGAYQRAAPTLTATAATTTATTASVQSHLNGNALSGTYQLHYGTTDQPQRNFTRNFDGTVREDLSGLTPSTTYNYTLTATTLDGTATSTGSFTTLAPVAPDVSKPTVTDTTQTGATVHATVNPNELATSYHFEYAPGDLNGSVQSSAPTNLPAGTTAVAVAATLGGLTPGTTYAVRAVASNLGGVKQGEVATFTTAAAAQPTPTASATVAPTATASPAPTAAPTATPVPPKPKPALTGLKLAAKKIKPGKSTTLKLTLNGTGATVSVAFAKQFKGTLKGKKCVAHKACTGYKALKGTVKVKLATGARTIKIGPKIGGAKAKAGVYRLTIVATAGTQKTAAKTLTLTVK